MRSDTPTWSKLLERLGDYASTMLRAQVDAGADAVQLFDSWAGVLSPADYEAFVLPASRHVLVRPGRSRGAPDPFRRRVPASFSGLMGDAGAEVVGVDWRVPLDVARERVGPGRALQGNLDPTSCLAPWPVVEAAAIDVLRRGGGTGHIFNLGHGVLPETDPDVLHRIVDLVHEWEPDSAGDA